MDEPEIWDWTKLNSYACMLRGHYAMEKHLVPNEPAEALIFGQGLHKMAEVWTKESCHNVIEQQANPFPYPLTNLPDPLDRAKKAFLEVWEKGLSLELREKLELEGNRRSYANACRLFEAYTRKFPIEMFNKIVAVEVPFTIYLGETRNACPVHWTGKLDRVAEWQGATYYVDLKTSTYPLDDKFFAKFRYNGQMLGYAWAGEQLGYGNFSGIMVHGIEVKIPQQGIKRKIDGTPYARQGREAMDLIQSDIITIYPNAIKEWKAKTLWKIDKIYEARNAGYWEPDMGNICNEFNGCAFQRLCSSPSDLREVRKLEHYQLRPWTPL